jgi:hypothetical protein
LSSACDVWLSAACSFGWIDRRQRLAFPDTLTRVSMELCHQSADVECQIGLRLEV